MFFEIFSNGVTLSRGAIKLHPFSTCASLNLALVPKGCNFIAPLILIQQFLIAQFFSFSEHCSSSFPLNYCHKIGCINDDGKWSNIFQVATMATQKGDTYTYYSSRFSSSENPLGSSSSSWWWSSKPFDLLAVSIFGLGQQCQHWGPVTCRPFGLAGWARPACYSPELAATAKMAV